jgi:type IV secretory pathway VirB2 component (pilin)
LLNLNITFYILNMKKISSKALTTGVLFLGTLSSVAANPSSWIDNIDGPKKDLSTWVVEIINWMIGAAALAAVVMLIAAGFMYITANGAEDKITKATKTLTFAIVGLVVCFIAVMLVNFVLKTWLSQS